MSPQNHPTICAGIFFISLTYVACTDTERYIQNPISSLHVTEGTYEGSEWKRPTLDQSTVDSLATSEDFK